MQSRTTDSSLVPYLVLQFDDDTGHQHHLSVRVLEARQSTRHGTRSKREEIFIRFNRAENKIGHPAITFDSAVCLNSCSSRVNGSLVMQSDEYVGMGPPPPPPPPLVDAPFLCKVNWPGVDWFFSSSSVCVDGPSGKSYIYIYIHTVYSVHYSTHS